ncbi:hypothetical protein [Planomicrobium okeanokoites]|uniref:hypothetical protein n=1 Tax=Planomicrobium okeanokoites TaxID=244 RepID=UPI0024933235|nr:hypothetical protein [Planomicrobium okeanokoites]
MEGVIEKFYPKEGYGYIMDTYGDKWHFTIKQGIFIYQIADDIDNEIEPIRYYVKQVLSPLELEEEMKVVFKPIDKNDEKSAENVMLIKEEWEDCLLSAEIVYIELVRQTEQFLQFLGQASSIFKFNYEKPDYQKISRRIDNIKNGKVDYFEVEFNGPKVEIKVLIEGKDYKIGEYQSKVICENLNNLDYKLREEHSYMCDVLTPVFISTWHNGDDDWESFRMHLENRLKKVKKNVTGPNPQYIRDLANRKISSEMDYRSNQESKGKW